jgi:hypothetical protein
LKGAAVLASILMVVSAGIILTLGVLHLIYTFSGKKLEPRDPALQVRMAEVAPIITRQTTMWKGWIGFNATHSFGLILFGLVYGYLAVAHREILFNSPFLLAIGLVMFCALVVISRVYFFSTPFHGRSPRNNILYRERYTEGLAVNLNSGTPWSKPSLIDLLNSMRLGESVEEIADFLCRDIQEVRDKVAEINPQYPGLHD